MERLLTALLFGFGIAPLFFVGTIKLIDWLNGASAPEHSISFSTGLFIGAGMVVLGFGLAGGLAWLASGRGYLRPVQAITSLLVAGWGLFGAVFYWNEPRQLDYVGQQGWLDIEVRLAKVLIGGQALDYVLRPSFTGGNFGNVHQASLRDEGDFLVIPLETTVTVVYDWAIWITLLYDQRLYFPMNLPYRPRQSTAWSNWGVPKPHNGATTPTGVLLRYRFRLVPDTGLSYKNAEK